MVKTEKAGMDNDNGDAVDECCLILTRIVNQHDVDPKWVRTPENREKIELR